MWVLLRNLNLFGLLYLSSYLWYFSRQNHLLVLIVDHFRLFEVVGYKIGYFSKYLLNKEMVV